MSRACARYGTIAPTGYYNVMVIRVANRAGMMMELAGRIEDSPGSMNDLSRVVPAMHTFNFQNAQEFEEQARTIVLQWLGQLDDSTFHVRLLCRGFKGALSSPHEERVLDEAILDGLQELNTPGQIGFEDPDAVIDIETVGNRAGITLWTREDLQCFELLRPD